MSKKPINKDKLIKFKHAFDAAAVSKRIVVANRKLRAAKKLAVAARAEEIRGKEMQARTVLPTRVGMVRVS